MESEKSSRMRALVEPFRAFAAASPWNVYRMKMLRAAELLERQAAREPQPH